MCSVSAQEIARHLRPDTLRALYGKNKVLNAIHCTDLPEDGILEVSSSKPHSNVMQVPHSHVLYSVSFWGSLFALQKYFWIPQMRMKPRTKWHLGLMTVRSGPRQTHSPAHRKGSRRVELFVMPRSGFGPVDVIVVHNSWSVQPPSTNGPLLIICLLTDSAMTFQELRPHRGPAQTPAAVTGTIQGKSIVWK